MSHMPLQRELSFFNKHKVEYLKLYRNKFVLVKGEELFGSFDTEEEAYKIGITSFGNEPFLIKQVLEEEPTLTISSLFMGMTNAGL